MLRFDVGGMNGDSVWSGAGIGVAVSGRKRAVRFRSRAIATCELVPQNYELLLVNLRVEVRKGTPKGEGHGEDPGLVLHVVWTSEQRLAAVEAPYSVWLRFPGDRLCDRPTRMPRQGYTHGEIGQYE